MKKLILAGIAAAALCGAPAYAAPPVFDWSGFYIGAEGGGGWGMAGVRGIANDADLSGALGGVQIGNNWQNGNWVTGVKADINLSHLNGSVNWGGAIYSGTVNWFGTAEMQAGVLVTPTSKLYATGGLAFGHVNAKLVDIDIFKASHTMAGYTAGAGYEWVFNTNTSVFVEYKYLNLGTKTFVLDDPEQVHVRFSVVKVGVNWKYGTR
jgi:outer membrane immunogenic protein